LVGAPPQPLSINQSMALIEQGALQAAIVLWDAIWHAMLGWLLIGPVAIAVCYALSRWLLRRIEQRTPAATAAAPIAIGTPEA
jgi:hypothetical protein